MLLRIGAAAAVRRVVTTIGRRALVIGDANQFVRRSFIIALDVQLEIVEWIVNLRLDLGLPASFRAETLKKKFRIFWNFSEFFGILRKFSEFFGIFGIF